MCIISNNVCVNLLWIMNALSIYFTDVLEEALLETDHNGILTDVLLMMMTAIFSLQEQEEAEEEELSKQDEAVTGGISYLLAKCL